ncbi:minor capsid protein [Bacillus spizizenii]|nr:minor capsid protein [Bacillus spizizenii]
MAKPIPPKLLFHSIEYEEYIDEDQSNGWGGEVSPSQTIQNVRVEPITAITRSNIRDDVEGESIVFIDRLNSKPFIKLKEKSKVKFEGKTYEIHRVKALYDENPGTPHHYEVELK